jgi:hypothetical protein
MFPLLHRRNMIKVLEINVVMTTSSLHFHSPHKHGGGGCRRSKKNIKKNMKRGEQMCWKMTLI